MIVGMILGAVITAPITLLACFWFCDDDPERRYVKGYHDGYFQALGERNID